MTVDGVLKNAQARDGTPSKATITNKTRPAWSFPPASQAGRLAGPEFYTISFLWATRLINVGGRGVWRWPDPEERCTKTPDSGSGPWEKAKGAGGLDSKGMEAY